MRGSDPPVTKESLEDGRKRREEESGRARARTRILDQVRGQAKAKAPVPATLKGPIIPKRRVRAEDEEWQWSQKKGSSDVGSEDREKEEQDRRRVCSASTWTPPRKRSASLRTLPQENVEPNVIQHLTSLLLDS